MKKIERNLKESGHEIETQRSGQGSKYLLPKLKSYSQNDVFTSSNLHVKTSPNSHYSFNHERNSGIDLSTNKTELSKLSLIKYQYVSKSPAYFRRQSRSIKSGRFDEHSYHQPVQTYVVSKMKEFDKQALLDLINNRVKSVKNPNSKLNTIEQSTNTENVTVNSRLTKSKINYEKLKANLSAQKFSYMLPSSHTNLKSSIQAQESGYQENLKSGKNTNNISNQKPLIQIKQESQQQVEKSVRKFKTLEHKNVQFYQTKYSHFEPNKIENVKSHIQNIRKHPSFKLNLYNFQ